MKPMEDQGIEEILSKLIVGAGRGSHVALPQPGSPKITEVFERCLKSDNNTPPDIDKNFERV